MTVYVDNLRPRPWVCNPAYHCHMMAESDSELEAMARRLSLKPEWKHGDHYDLTAAKRHQAVEVGAVQVTARDLVRLRRERR